MWFVRDVDVRAALTDAIAAQHPTGPYMLVPEVDIRWSVPARIDVLLVADRINAFEIKSDADSLTRLPRQVESYSMIAERATLVVGARHHRAAAQLVPDWWSVWLATRGDDTVTIRQVRRGRLNPDVNPVAVTSFLDRVALVEVLRARGHARLSYLSVDQLRMAAARELGTRGTLDYARSHMMARHDWRARSLATA